jgi:hypothetical protein
MNIIMMMKATLLTKTLMMMVIFSLMSMISVFAQVPAGEFDPEKYKPGYTLGEPEGWGIERFAIPIGFAQSIAYKGVEDIRFAPGWGDAKSDGYWTYAFLWYLEGKVEITPQVTERNLAAYYDGLIGRNIERRRIPREKVTPVRVTMRKVAVESGDLQTYGGTIEMLDYMEQKPMKLNCVVHVKECAGRNSTYVFYEVSPRPMTDGLWKELRSLWTTFDCSPVK